MKRLRLWVKVVLVVLAVIVLSFLLKGFNDWNDKQVASCVEGGHTYQWCRGNL